MRRKALYENGKLVKLMGGETETITESVMNKINTQTIRNGDTTYETRTV